MNKLIIGICVQIGLLLLEEMIRRSIWDKAKTASSAFSAEADQHRDELRRRYGHRMDADIHGMFDHRS